MTMFKAKIGHVHLKVRDLRRSSDFYQRYLGMELIERHKGYVFLSGSESHHELALQELGSMAPAPLEIAVGLYHVAFEVPDKRSFGQAYLLLKTDYIPLAVVDHRVTWSIYFSDPDGNGVEIYCDTRLDPLGQKFWKGENMVLTEEQILSAL